MKNFVIYLALAMVVLAIVPTMAMATTTEKEIADLAMQNEKVVKAKCVVYERNCLVAIQTEKFQSRTEYCNFVEQFENQVKSKYQIDNIKVTRNPKVMSKLDHFEKLGDAERTEQIQKLIEYLLNKPMPLPARPLKPPFDR